MSADKLRAWLGDAEGAAHHTPGLTVVDEQWYPTTERVRGFVIDGGTTYTTALCFNGSSLRAVQCSCRHERPPCSHVVAMVRATQGRVLQTIDVDHPGLGSHEWRAATRSIARTPPSPQTPQPATTGALLFATSKSLGILMVPAVRVPTGGRDELLRMSWTGQGRTDYHDRVHAGHRALITAIGNLSDDPDPGWLEFNTLSADIWSLLHAADTAGVELLCIGSGATAGSTFTASGNIHLHSTIDLAAITKRRPTGAVALHFVAAVDNAAAAGADFIAIRGAEVSAGVAWYEGRNLHLGRWETTPPPAVSSLLRRGEPIVVPATEIADFADACLPLPHILIIDPDDLLNPVTVTGPIAVLRISQAGDDLYRVAWTVRYDVDGAPTDYPIAPDGGPHRSTSAEHALWQHLHTHVESVGHALGIRPHPRRAHDDPRRDYPLIGTDDMVALFTDVLPALRSVDDVIVEIADDIPDFRPATTAPVVRFEPGPEGIGRDWLNLTITVDIDGSRIPLETVIRDLATGQQHIVLPTGVYCPADIPALARLRELLTEARELGDITDSGDVRASTTNATLWDDIFDCGEVHQDLAQWADDHSALALTTPPAHIDLPATVHAELRDYQHEGVDWLGFLFANNIGGILADDMGLGKTLQLLTAIAIRWRADPAARFLVIAPTSVVTNWVTQAAAFVPSLRVAAVQKSTGRRGVPPDTEAATLIVTTYALVRLDPEFFAKQRWSLVVCDEAQAIKNPNAKGHEAVRSLDADITIATTGTPIENSLMDLWSLLDVTTPGLFPDKAAFTSYYRTPIEKGRDTERLAQLRQRIRPFLLRRNKEDVLTDLPPKQEQQIELELTPAHRRIYDRRLNLERQKSLALLDDSPLHAARFQVLSALTRLRQLSLHSGLVDPAHADVPSAKIAYLLEQLPLLSAGGHQGLVFSVFPTFLRILKPLLEDAGLRVAYLAGDVLGTKRAAEIDRFTAGDADVFLISLKAGGSGLNLVSASYVWLVDPWWNPAAEAQAIDRVHRIGQTKPVTVYRLVAADTVEGKVIDLQAGKRALAAAALDDDELFTSALTADDFRRLFD